MYFKTADVAGLRLFYREAGDPSKPTIVLLHGFPSSSYLFHDLIPLLRRCKRSARCPGRAGSHF